MALGSLAAGMVMGITQIAVVAFTLERAFLVDTNLGASSWVFTLVNIIASFVVDELVAGVAGAVVAGGRVDAELRAVAVVLEALVDAAPVARLVLALRTVLLAVAHLLHANAHVVAAVEFRVRVARRPLCRTILIAAILTVVDAVAEEMAGDAVATLALELVVATGEVGALLEPLVAAVRAVVVAVAQPRLVDARQPVRALELALCAHRLEDRLVRRAAILFIFTIRTVQILVTSPVDVDANGSVAAGESAGRIALEGRTIVLIGSILAVEVAVTHPSLLNALAIAACELV